VSRSFLVLWQFSGFFSPVDNPPALNSQNAGSTVPVKFGLGGDRGLAIFAAGSPQSVQISCTTLAPMGSPTPIGSPGASGLTYDGQYHINWKTDKAWAGTCRQLQVVLLDGSTHVANFKFK